MRLTEKEGASFKERIAQASLRNSTRIIVAIDINQGSSKRTVHETDRLLRKITEHVCAVKFGRQSVLNLGTTRISRLLRRVRKDDLPCIVDDKLNDIGETNKGIVEAYFKMGFDAITVNPFAGWEGGLQPVFQVAHEADKGILALVYMSHPGASEGYGQKVLRPSSGRLAPQYILFAQKTVAWKADGAVVGATRPSVVREVKSILGRDVPIYSPGVGTQGGDLQRALRAGSDYFIIGRTITKSRDPERTTEFYARLSQKNL